MKTLPKSMKAVRSSTGAGSKAVVTKPQDALLNFSEMQRSPDVVRSAFKKWLASRIYTTEEIFIQSHKLRRAMKHIEPPISYLDLKIRSLWTFKNFHAVIATSGPEILKTFSALNYDSIDVVARSFEYIVQSNIYVHLKSWRQLLSRSTSYKELITSESSVAQMIERIDEKRRKLKLLHATSMACSHIEGNIDEYVQMRFVDALLTLKRNMYQALSENESDVHTPRLALLSTVTQDDIWSDQEESDEDSDDSFQKIFC